MKDLIWENELLTKRIELHQNQSINVSSEFVDEDSPKLTHKSFKIFEKLDILNQNYKPMDPILEEEASEKNRSFQSLICLEGFNRRPTFKISKSFLCSSF